MTIITQFMTGYPMIFNSVLFILSIIFYMGIVVFMYQRWGKVGLYMWSALAVIIVNIETLKLVEMFGMIATLGSSAYASTFLATDILCEKYGRKAGVKAVNISLTTTIIWMIGGQLALLYVPSNSDFIQESLRMVYQFSSIICIASLGTYLISQRLDVYLYGKWWLICEKIFKDKHRGLWIRNNGSTLISQFVDTCIYLGTVQILGGFYKWEEIPFLIISTYLLKAISGVMDTPFVYLARYLKDTGKVHELTEDVVEK